MVTSDSSPEVEIRPFRACAMHLAIIIGTVCSLWTWTWLWGRYHVPQNAFLVIIKNVIIIHRVLLPALHTRPGMHYKQVPVLG